MARIPQAGAIVFRSERGEARVLLVRAKSTPQAWIFPKGHLERGESMAAAALREAHEETGIDGVVVGLAGLPLAFRSKGENVSVEYLPDQSHERGAVTGRSRDAVVHDFRGTLPARAR